MRRLLAVVIAIAVMAVLGLAVIANLALDHSNREVVKDEQAQKLSLAQQIAEACAAGELHGTICGEAVDTIESPAPEAPRVIYIQGRPGPAGKNGIDGRPGADGQPGAAGRDSTVAGPQGPPGADGADSTVPGPQGPAGPPGPQGPPGADAPPPAGEPVTEEPPPPPAEPSQGLVGGLLSAL